MRFVCLECDETMKMLEMTPTHEGSLDLRYECPQCSWGVAMLTNPQETEMVASLGLKIGPGESPEAPLPAAAAKCPVAHVAARAIQEPSAEPARAEEPLPRAGGSASPTWTEAAEQRLDKIPEFVRPMARSGIEKLAREKGYSEIDEKVLDEAKDHFGM